MKARCQKCGRSIKVTRSHGRFCSAKCRMASWRAKKKEATA